MGIGDRGGLSGALWGWRPGLRRYKISVN